MYISLMLSALASSAAMTAEQFTPHDSCWKLDKTTVMSGGCLTMVLDDVCSALREVKLQIDDRDPVNMRGFVGPTIQRHHAPGGVTTTFILIGHDFRTPEGYELVVEEPETYRMVPIFDEPGTVRLTLTTDEGSLGTKVVTVLPLAPEAADAVRLLFPTVMKDQGPIRNWAECMGLLVSADHGPSARRDGPKLPEFAKELEVLRRHPDWAEIFEMLVAWVGARVAADEFREASRTRGDNMAPDVEPPALPAAVTKALTGEPMSAFAKAIQNSIRGTVASRKLFSQDNTRVPAANR